jgi:amidase
MDELHYLGAGELLVELAARRVSARELLDAHLDRHRTQHTALNAVVATDPDRAYAEARRVDDARVRNEPLGSLAGLPMTVKDGYDVTGMPAVCGVPALAGRPRECADADVVAAIRTAGAVVWGKTNVPLMLGDMQTYNEVYGTTNNPHDLTRTSGGSSGGAAAALAGGITPLEIGSDTGGSLRHPANFCGVYALKTTWGQLSLRGQVPPGPGTYTPMDLGVAGPMARGVADLRLLYRVLRRSAASDSAPPDRPPDSVRRGRYRVALWVDEPEFALDREVRVAVERAGALLGEQGVTVEVASPPLEAARLMDCYQSILNSTLMSASPDPLYERLVGRRAAAESGVAAGADRYSFDSFVLQATASFRAVHQARVVRQELKDALAEWFRGWDAILAPVGPVPAFTHRQQQPVTARSLDVNDREEPYFRLLDWIALASALHVPALAAPVGRTDAGLPLGAQLIGRWGEEEQLLTLGELLEQATGGCRPPVSWVAPESLPSEWYR